MSNSAAEDAEIQQHELDLINSAAASKRDEEWMQREEDEARDLEQW